jgi:hypothetical protein
MGGITGPDDRDPLLSCPKCKIFGIQASGGGSGVVGMDMEICNEFHVASIMEQPIRAHIRWRKELITGCELILDPGCWIPGNKEFIFALSSIKRPASSIIPILAQSSFSKLV